MLISQKANDEGRIVNVQGTEGLVLEKKYALKYHHIIIN